MIAQAQASTV